MSSNVKSSATTGSGSALVPKRRFPEFQNAGAWALVSLRRASVPVDERVGERKLTPVSMRIPTKPAMHSNMKPATYSDLKPATIPI